MNYGVAAILFVIQTHPLTDTPQNRDHRLTFFRQGILDPGWDFIVGSPFKDLRRDQLLERRCQYSVCYVSHFLSQFTVPKDFFSWQNADDSGFPFAPKYLNPIFEWAAYTLFQLWFVHEGSLLPVMIPYKEDKSKLLCNLWVTYKFTYIDAIHMRLQSHRSRKGMIRLKKKAVFLLMFLGILPGLSCLYPYWTALIV